MKLPSPFVLRGRGADHLAAFGLGDVANANLDRVGKGSPVCTSAQRRGWQTRRVTGFLQEMLFKDGEFVREGNVLSPIERASSDAAQQQARGALLLVCGYEQPG